MLKAILFDLDDTLLGNSMDTFVPAYFQALTRWVAHLIPPEQLIPELMRATEAMVANDGSGPTNEEVFAAIFYPALGYDQDEVKPVFEQFYEQEFPRLQSLTQVRPVARPLVEWAFERGLQVVIATNPLFPRLPIEQRLAWAGVPVTEFDYDLVTCYENMHATKSHPAYYREILTRLGREPGECLMVGDDRERDIAQAASVGIPVYWIIQPGDTLLPFRPSDKRKASLLAGQGTLAELWELARTGSLVL